MNTVGSLEKVYTMSPWQLGIILVMVGSGSGMITSASVLFPVAGQLAWLVPLIAGWAYFGVAYLIIKLGELFPQETFVVYFRRIWGRWLATTLVWFLVVVMIGRVLTIIQVFAREITFFMFDRTPMEVIILSLLGVAAYCALQDFGTVLKMTQILFFTALPMLIGIQLICFINFQFINIYPFWPIDITGFVKASQECWIFFVGYEFMFWLLPLVNRSKSSVTKAVGSAFALKALLIAFSMFMALGVLTLEGVKATPYPVSISVRSIELPGTFIERMDNYLFLAWIPLVFTTQVFPLFVIANILAETHGYSDHRPFVLLLIPILFAGTMALHDMPTFSAFIRLVHWPGLVFSFAIVPATYLLARWKRQRQQVAAP